MGFVPETLELPLPIAAMGFMKVLFKISSDMMPDKKNEEK